MKMKKKSSKKTIVEKQNVIQKTEKELVNELLDELMNIKITVSNSRVNSYYDNSVIDVTDQSYKIDSNSRLKKNDNEIPFWSHQYVYSHTEINSATRKQKKFYLFFKRSFLEGEYLDLEGNNNYAFILLFDLLNEFETHTDLLKLENQLKFLGQFYPKTKSYGMRFLIQKMEANGDFEGKSRIREEENSYRNNYSSYDYDYWGLGSKYKAKLGLNDSEAELLNQLWYPSNNFCQIEFCCLEILKLFVGVVFELRKYYENKDTTLDEQLNQIADVIARKQYRYKNGSWNYRNLLETTPREVYSHVFKYCENAVRAYYGHKRKLNTATYYTNKNVKIEYEVKIISKIEEIITSLINQISPPDKETEIMLYAQTTTRWKIKFEELKTNYSKDPENFVSEIISLGKLNRKNPSIENIFFEASKFISKFNNVSALILYVHYIHHDLKSVKVNKKQLTKTIQKKLFKTKKQFQDFENIINDFINDKNFDKALLSIPKIYEVKRKKIKLDRPSIKDVQQQHTGTVELLNEYLQEDLEEGHINIETQENRNEELEIEIVPEKQVVSESPFTNELGFSEIQTTTLQLFLKSSFSVPEEELKAFAKANGVFKNQLIESINETCYELLDDVLIEEEEEHYIINTNYFDQILVK